ncbi:MAG: hypothetical protein WAU54_10835 [Chania sp.]
MSDHEGGASGFGWGAKVGKIGQWELCLTGTNLYLGAIVAVSK